jgi:hypothetical protein
MAGAEGFEPPKAVLETAGLPLAYAPTRPASTTSLLNFPMCPMATAKGAELLQLQPLGLGLLVLRLAIVLAFALGALHCNDFAHSFAPFGRKRPESRSQNPECRRSTILNPEFSNSEFFYSIISVTVPAPTVRPPSRIANRNPLSMATGVINSITNPTLSPGITISVPAGNSATPVTSVVRK